MAVNHGGRPPRAVIHKRILESAAARPDASVEELAADLAGASPALVERVLDEYGDPAKAEPEAGTTGEEAEAAADAGSTDQGLPPPIPSELTEKQRRTLRAVAEHPDATQAELADRLDVSAATVSKRVNAVEGFDWTERQAFVDRLFGPLDEVTGDGADGEADRATAAEAVDAAERGADGSIAADQPAASAGASAAPAASDGGQLLDADTERAVEQLQERLARLEGQVGEAAGGPGAGIDDAELLAKVVRAVVADDAITDDEEVRVLEALLEGSASG